MPPRETALGLKHHVPHCGISQTRTCIFHEGKLGLGVAWVKLAWGWRPQQVLLPGACEMQMIGTIGPLSPGHLQ